MGNDKHNTEGFIPLHGGYRNLITFQKSEIIYDGTVYFTKRFLGKYDRTIDQMVQAARSGKQNIAEASMASATSIVTYLLNQQIKALEKAFINEGGLRERMTKARIDKRNSNK